MSEPFNVVIVGGGSAGWMTAAYLSKALARDVRITLVESSNIGRIGVGEATFSTIRLFFEFLGLDEADWMPACHATYKVAIKFVDWNRERVPFYHPFQRYEAVRGYNMAEWWLKLLRHDQRFDQACFLVPAICDAKRSPRHLDGHTFCDRYEAHVKTMGRMRATMLQNFQGQYPYAYHFDAQLIADFLCAYAMQRDVRRIEDDVVRVTRMADGNIRGVVTQGHGEVEGDLFVDCTGFRGLLINQTLGEPFISFAPSLLCDRAVAMQVPSDIACVGINPYTTATALSSGWVWDIPLYGRRGTGYVYSSAFLAPDAAEEELRRHLGPVAIGRKASHISMRVGRNRNSWVKNCVAIGLSSGFVEPLESTGIFFIQQGIEELITHFPGRTRDEESIKSYNTAVARCIDGVREFLTLHYCASTRGDTPFWQATKHEIDTGADLAERLKLWKRRLPTNRTINPHYHGFEAYSYSVMLLGLGYRPDRNLPALDHMDDGDARAMFAWLRDQAAALTATLPSQYEYLSAAVHRTRTLAEAHAVS